MYLNERLLFKKSPVIFLPYQIENISYSNKKLFRNGTESNLNNYENNQ